MEETVVCFGDDPVFVLHWRMYMYMHTNIEMDRKNPIPMNITVNTFLDDASSVEIFCGVFVGVFVGGFVDVGILLGNFVGVIDGIFDGESVGVIDGLFDGTLVGVVLGLVIDCRHNGSSSLSHLKSFHPNDLAFHIPIHCSDTSCGSTLCHGDPIIGEPFSSNPRVSSTGVPSTYSYEFAAFLLFNPNQQPFAGGLLVIQTLIALVFWVELIMDANTPALFSQYSIASLYVTGTDPVNNIDPIPFHIKFANKKKHKVAMFC
mmetsp:Transcript_35800/g.44218  ORF Transcript_35800/g.44218 Transcript_35800/m.44218 type:complete len:261 (+) Transcript_35800:315-1097(+)